MKRGDARGQDRRPDPKNDCAPKITELPAVARLAPPPPERPVTAPTSVPSPVDNSATPVPAMKKKNPARPSAPSGGHYPRRAALSPRKSKEPMLPLNAVPRNFGLREDGGRCPYSNTVIGQAEAAFADTSRPCVQYASTYYATYSHPRDLGGPDYPFQETEKKLRFYLEVSIMTVEVQFRRHIILSECLK